MKKPYLREITKHGGTVEHDGRRDKGREKVEGGERETERKPEEIGKKALCLVLKLIHICDGTCRCKCPKCRRK